MSQQTEHELLQDVVVRLRTIRTTTMPSKRRREQRIHSDQVEMAYIEGVLETLLSRRSATIDLVPVVSGEITNAAERLPSGASRSAAVTSGKSS